MTKIHTFKIDLRDLGKFEAKVSHAAMLKLLAFHFPDYNALDKETQEKAWETTCRIARRKLVQTYELKYAPETRYQKNYIQTWRNQSYV